MKKLTLFIILIAFSIHAAGQMPLPKKPNTSRYSGLPKAYYFSDWSLGLSIKSSLENIQPDFVATSEYKFEYKPKFSYEIELFTERKLIDKWIFVGGINFHKVSIAYKQNFPIIFNKNNNSSVGNKFTNQHELTINNTFEQLKFIGTVEYTILADENDYQDGDELNLGVSSVNTINYFGVPIALKKEIGYGKLRLSLKAGIEPAVVVKSKNNYQKYHQPGFYVEGSRPDFETNRIGSIPIQRAKLSDLEIIFQANNLRAVQLNGFFNIGLLHTYKYYTFLLEAEFKRGALKLSQNNIHSSHLYSLGFKTGFIKRFKENKVIDLSRRKFRFKW